jgi:hypothetical protein
VLFRSKKLVHNETQIEDLLITLFLESFDEEPEEIVFDFDATDIPIHGEQEGRFFHGYYRHYCYLPWYFFCGEQLLCARLRKSDTDPAKGVIEEMERMVKQIRAEWPEVRIILRGDSGCCREELMSWCEGKPGIEYVFGLAQNNRLRKTILAESEKAREQYEATQEPARVFKDFRYQTLKSWSCERRVVGKAEHLSKGANPRFIVTSLASDEWEDRALYEDLYCARGEMENRIKEQQLALFADRTSTAAIRSNQLRLYFSSFAYVLMQTLRRLGLEGTELAKAQCDTIRLKLLKIGAQLKVTVRKVWISFSESYPYLRLFREVFNRLSRIPARC